MLLSHWFIVSIFILNVTLTGDFYPLNLKSDPLRKTLGFELLSDKIENRFNTDLISAIVFIKILMGNINLRVGF